MAGKIITQDEYEAQYNTAKQANSSLTYAEFNSFLQTAGYDPESIPAPETMEVNPTADPFDPPPSNTAAPAAQKSPAARYGPVNRNYITNSAGEAVTAPGNVMTGDYGMDEGGYWFGGTKDGFTNSGVAQPLVKGALTAWETYQAYQASEELKKQNAAKISMANEGIYMKRVDQHNKVASQRRNQQMGLGNANNTGHMTTIVANNPYKTYRDYSVPYNA